MCCNVSIVPAGGAGPGYGGVAGGGYPGKLCHTKLALFLTFSMLFVIMRYIEKKDKPCGLPKRDQHMHKRGKLLLFYFFRVLGLGW